MLIAIEGIDGSGKGTQTKLLCDRLNASYDSMGATFFSFPRYTQTFFGPKIGDYLNGKFGPLGAVHPFLAASLYAADRWQSKNEIEEAMRDYKVVILDRWVDSNLAHQGARIMDGKLREALLADIRYLEYAIYGVPEPDLTIWLRISVELAVSRIAMKPKRSYTAKTADLHEEDKVYLERTANAYEDLYRTFSDKHKLIKVDAGYVTKPEPGREVRLAEEINDEIWTGLMLNALSRV